MSERTEKKLMDTIKMIGYRAETSLANHIKPMMNSPEQARNLIRSIYQSNADLKIDKQNNRLLDCAYCCTTVILRLLTILYWSY